METRTLLFDKPGEDNTAATLRAAHERAQELGIRQVVVASSHGGTALAAQKLFAGQARVIAVTISAAYESVGWAMTAGERAKLEGAGVTVLTGLHALGDDVSDALGFVAPNRVVRTALYRFCQGMKVAVEVALMAAEAGLLDMQQEVLAIGGTGSGADTAIVVRPAYCRTFEDFEIREILAKPRRASES